MKPIAVVALIIFAQIALAQPPGGPAGRGACCMPNRPLGPGAEFMKDLNLSEKQMDDLHALRTAFEKVMIETQSQIRLLRVDIRELAGTEKPDRQAIEKKLRDISDLQLKEKLALVDHLFQAKSILTPEQQKKFRGHMIGRLLGDGGMTGEGMMKRPMMKHRMMKHRMMDQQNEPEDK
jgi:Spy/CpxP family protein refolding chaperone